MRRSTLVYIGIGTFLACWILLFALPCMVRDCPVSELVRLTEGMTANFLLLVLIFSGVAVCVPLAADWVAVYLKRFKPFRPKVGEILVRRGYLTAEQLESALGIQQLRTGELLCRMGCLTESQLQEALLLQRKGDSRRLGEILVALGYASEREVQRAQQQMDRKLGRILIDMGLIRKDELRAVLGRQWYARRHGY